MYIYWNCYYKFIKTSSILDHCFYSMFVIFQSTNYLLLPTPLEQYGTKTFHLLFISFFIHLMLKMQHTSVKNNTYNICNIMLNKKSYNKKLFKKIYIFWKSKYCEHMETQILRTATFLAQYAQIRNFTKKYIYLRNTGFLVIFYISQVRESQQGI